MLLDIIKDNQTNGCPVHLAGDGKYDSPGRFLGNKTGVSNSNSRIFGCILYVHSTGPEHSSNHWLVCCSEVSGLGIFYISSSIS